MHCPLLCVQNWSSTTSGGSALRRYASLHSAGLPSDEQTGLAFGLLLEARSSSIEVRPAAFAMSSSSGQKPGEKGGGGGGGAGGELGGGGGGGGELGGGLGGGGDGGGDGGGLGGGDGGGDGGGRLP